MPVYDSAIMALTENEAVPTHFIRVKSGLNRIDVVYAEGATGTLVPKSTIDPDNPDSFATVKEDGVDLELLGSYGFSVLGPGLIGFETSGVTGSITVRGTR